jgi:CBS domain-containing protein
MNAKELMAREPLVVTPGDPVLRAAQVMRDLDVGMVPVVESREGMVPVGVITDRDIVVRHVAAAHLHGCTCGHVMSRGPLVTVASDAPVEEVTRQMAVHRVRRVLVVDGGRLTGIVSAADVLAHDRGAAHEFVDTLLQRVAEPDLAYA